MRMAKKFFHSLSLRWFLRYGNYIAMYGSVKKIFNALYAICNYFRGCEKIDSMPLFLKIEISRHCTVNCLYCLSEKEERYFSYGNFKQIIDDYSKYVFMVQLHEIGEPLQHVKVIDFIKYAHSHGIATVISTSLSVNRSPDFWQSFVESGLDYLIVAIDGITAKVYKKYRRNGDFELVMKNLKTILEIKKRYKNKLFVEWQMIDLPWNRHEQKYAEEMASLIGCDAFRVIPDAVSIRLKSRESEKIRKSNCLWPYLLLLVNSYYDVIPCFKPSCNPGVLGNLEKNGLKEIWNGSEIQRIRSRKKIVERPGCMYCAE